MMAFIWHQDGADFAISDGQVVVDDGLNSLVILLLFTDNRASEDDALPHGQTDRRGWCGNPYQKRAWGSRLWLLEREKITTQTLHKIKNYALEALKPLLDEGMAKMLNVQVSRMSRDLVYMTIEITKPDETKITYGVKMRWQSQQNATNQAVSYGI